MNKKESVMGGVAGKQMPVHGPAVFELIKNRVANADAPLH
jgi:hypothetical protein